MNTKFTSSKVCLQATCKPATIKCVKRGVSAKAVDTQLVMCGSTALALAVGRFVMRPKGYLVMNAENCGRQLMSEEPTTPPETGFFQALEQSNDPAGFSIGDVIQYGAIGHILGVGTITSLQLQTAQYEGSYKAIPFLQLLQGVPYDQVKSTISGPGF